MNQSGNGMPPTPPTGMENPMFSPFPRMGANPMNSNNPMMSPNPFGRMPNMAGMPGMPSIDRPVDKNPNDEFNVDELVKKIDAKSHWR